MRLFRSSYQLILPTITSLIIFAFTSTVLNFSSFGVGVFFDTASIIIVLVNGQLLYLAAFRKQGSETINFFKYKVFWLLEIFFILGGLGAVLGISFMAVGAIMPPEPGIDAAAKLGAGAAVSMITICYGVFLGLSCLIISYFADHQVKFEDDNVIKNTASKVRLQAIIGIILSIIITVYVILLVLSASGISFSDMYGDFMFIYLLMFFLLLSYILYPHRDINDSSGLFSIIRSKFVGIARLKLSIFYNKDEGHDFLVSNLSYIRFLKKTIASSGVLLLTILPILMLASMAMPPEPDVTPGMTMFLLLIESTSYYALFLFFISLLSVYEGNLVQKINAIYNEFLPGDRYFIFKYILGPLVVWYLILIGVIVLFIYV